MKSYVGKVVSNVDENGNGQIIATFPKLFDNKPQIVTYTSPFLKANGGGMVAVPEPGDEIIAMFNDNPTPEERSLYYQTSIGKDTQLNGNKEVNENFESLRSNDSKAKIYGGENKPVTQTFVNNAGAGLYIQREFAESKISNNVTLKSETDNEINVGTVGIQLRNNEGDSIVLNGSEPNDQYAARSFGIETFASQEYKCTNSDIKMKVVDGGDINIENNSTGLFSISGKWFGNIRLKSRFRNIDLAALGDGSYVNIITKGAKIQVDSTGAVKIETIGSIDFNAAQDINMTAGGSVNIVGNAGAQIGSTEGAAQVNAPTVFINNQAFSFNAGPPGSDFTNSIPVVGAPATPAVPPVITPNDYNDPIGSV